MDKKKENDIRIRCIKKTIENVWSYIVLVNSKTTIKYVWTSLWDVQVQKLIFALIILGAEEISKAKIQK